MVLYEALSESSAPPISVSAVVQGILNLCKEFQRVEFSHVRRVGNKPAHLLAKYAASIVHYIAWIEEVPYFLEQNLIHDVTLNLQTYKNFHVSYKKKKKKRKKKINS